MVNGRPCPSLKLPGFRSPAPRKGQWNEFSAKTHLGAVAPDSIRIGGKGEVASEVELGGDRWWIGDRRTLTRCACQIDRIEFSFRERAVVEAQFIESTAIAIGIAAKHAPAKVQVGARLRAEGADDLLHDGGAVEEEAGHAPGAVVGECHMLPDTGAHQAGRRAQGMGGSVGVH